MDSFFLNWYSFWKKQKTFFFSMLGLFLILGSLAVSQVKVLPDISLDLKLVFGFVLIPLLILMLFFRKTYLVPLSLIPATLGGIFTLSVYYLLDGEISSHDLMIGGAISGVIFTYTIHVFSNLKRTNSIEETIKMVFQPLFIGALITSLCLFLLYFTDSKLLQNIGLFGGLNIIGGLVGLLFVLPILIQNKLKFKEDTIKFNIGFFSIKSKLIRFLLVTVLFIATVWLMYEALSIHIYSVDLVQNTKFLFYGFGIVFLLLLMVYGRVEYALITFLPIVMSWIWTFGISSLIGLELNEYLIFAFSLIFGFTLGSTILLSDGYRMIYSYGDKRKNASPISLFMVGIILTCTVPVLFFSSDPTIESLAVFSIIGSLCFLLFSLFFQSYLIQLLIVNRAQKKKTPLTLIGILVSVFGFSYFLFGCLLLFIVHLFFRIIPFKQKKLKSAFRWLLSKFAYSMVYVLINTKKRRYDFHHLDFSKPSIIIANHQSFLDILNMVMLNKNIVLMTNEWVFKSPVFGVIIRYAGYLRASNGVDVNLEDIQDRINDGLSVVIFPEGTRSETGKINRFHKGAFYLAEKTELPIQPILIQGHSYTMSKGDYLLKNGYMNLKALPQIELNDTSFGEGYKERTKKIAQYFRTEHQNFNDEINDSEYQFDRVIHNYILKNPITEWYIRIKWKFESKNYDFYNSFLKSDSKIYDLGCGYGYMSYYFGFRGPERTVIGMDYDEDKITVAQNCYDRSDNIQFSSGDIRNYIIEDADAVFLTDVIHYLPKDEQFKVLEKCVKGLSKSGVLFLRDGISDYHERFEKTKLTEKFSTKILGFNKSENELHFFSKQDVFDFAKKHNLQCEMKEQSQKTSNVLFILSK